MSIAFDKRDYQYHSSESEDEKISSDEEEKVHVEHTDSYPSAFVFDLHEEIQEYCSSLNLNLFDKCTVFDICDLVYHHDPYKAFE
jgi:hypothetical protein